MAAVLAVDAPEHEAHVGSVGEEDAAVVHGGDAGRLRHALGHLGVHQVGQRLEHVARELRVVGPQQHQ